LPLAEWWYGVRPSPGHQYSVISVMQIG
jgi:hypothetical protein